MRLQRNRIRAGFLAVALVAPLALASCADSERGDSADTFVFAASAEPVTLDPFYASDGETFRVTRQIYEGLVGTVPGTADPAPLLATAWETTPDGLTYSFDLRDDVTFHDGTDFNADAVCANFDRWYNLPESAQTEDLTYYYGKLFRGFATGPAAKDAIYESCTVDSEFKATIKLNAPFAGFISAMSMPAFSMQSPAALEKYQDDAAENPRNSEYSTAHPTGTGPFTLESWTREENVTLARYDDYWGEVASIEKAVVVAIDQPKGRADALKKGEIDGFDLVGPADLASLEEAGMTLEQRPAFNVLYLGMNQAQKPLDDIRVRKAIAHAINIEEVISASMPEGTQAATQFIPDLVNGYSENVPTYEFDQDEARRLLKAAGATGATIPFNYPTGVSRPYMPDPQATFNIIRTQLAAVGLKITPVADQWDPDYLERIQGGSDHGIHLLGWTGDYNDTDNFLGVFFGGFANEWGFRNKEIFDGIREARGIATIEEQTPLYQEVNDKIMEFLPGVPLAHPVPSLAFAPTVKGYEPSPVQDEVWNTITIEDE